MSRKCHPIGPLAAILLLLISPAAQARDRDMGAEMAKQVINRNFPDPDIFAADGTYYAYGTNTAGFNVQLATATGPAGPWQQRPDAMPHLPPWIGPAESGSLNIWAPDVSAREDGTFLLYYTANHAASGRQCIGAAVAGSPLGPFEPTSPEPLICAPGKGDVIDPASFIDEDGTRYLLYKDSQGPLARSGPSTIHLRPMAADGLTSTGPDVALLSADRAEENGVVEAPTMVRRPEGYVLFYSGNTFDSGHYFSNFATSTTPSGPFSKAPGQFLTRDSLGGAVTNPGGQDIFGDGGWLAFHGDLAEPPGDRAMYVSGLSWNGLNPVLAPDPRA